jgi:hypothetical protein
MKKANTMKAKKGEHDESQEGWMPLFLHHRPEEV